MKSLYHHVPEASIIPAREKTFRRCFVVPGQGSAYPGMFSSFLEHDEDFRELFREADAAAAFHDLLPLSTYLTRPQILPKEKTHIYRNCALFTCEVAIGRGLIRKGIVPDSITGHSFGECAGLVLSGLISFEEMLSVVIHRNLLCPPAHELGMMITLSAEREKIAPLLASSGVYIANLNSPKQTVISVAAWEKERALEWLRKNRVPHLLLVELPQPYHSPLMEPYRKLLFERIKKLPLTIREPQYDFFSGIFHRWIDRKNYQEIDFVDLLSRQFTEPVNFIEQINAVKQRETTSYYEVGPGKMLEHSIRSILEGSVHYRDMDSHFPLLAGPRKRSTVRISPDSKWFGKIREIIQSVTGYGEKDIQPENSFQNDLGIDSLRKAEILVRLIKEEGLNPNADFAITRFSYIHEAVEYLENYSESADPLIVRHEKLIQNLVPAWTPAPLATFGHMEHEKSFFLKEMSPSQFSWADAGEISALAHRSGKRPLIILKCQGTLSQDTLLKFHAGIHSFIRSGQKPHFIVLDQTIHFEFSPVGALLRSLSKESKTFSVGVIHDPDASVSHDILLRETVMGHLRDVQWKDGKRLVKELSPLSVTRSPFRKLRILAIGGSKGIGQSLLTQIPEEARGELFLVGRSSESDAAISSTLSSLKSLWPKFTYVSCEASQLETLSEKIKSFFGKSEIDYIINSAGTEVSRAFEERETQDLLKEIESKLGPFSAIEKLAKDISVQKIFHFTSVVSQFGNKGQATYSWSNAWMEGRLGPRSHALAWAPWENVGMTANPGLLQKIREWGISLVSPEEGLSLFLDLLFARENLPPVIVPMDRKDVLLFGVEQVQRSQLGELTNNFEAVFLREISLADSPWLKGHVLLGQNLVPAAYYLSQLLNLGRAQWGRMVALTNLEVHNALIIENGHCSFKLQCFNRPPYDVSVSSIITHLTARFDPGRMLPALHKGKGPGERAVKLETFYDDNGFGESFQFIRSAFVDSNRQVRVAVKSSEMPTLTGDRQFDFWLVLLDMAFQSLTMQMKIIDGGAIIPVSFGEIVFSPEVNITEDISFWPEVTEINGKFGQASISFANSHGEVFCRMKDARYKIHYFKTITPIALQEAK